MSANSKTIPVLNSKNKLVGRAEASQEGDALALQHLIYLRKFGSGGIVQVFDGMTRESEEVIDAEMKENPISARITVATEIASSLPKPKKRKAFLTPINELLNY